MSGRWALVGGPDLASRPYVEGPGLVLQKLGKADETRDVVFEEMVTNFNKQMNEGTKLQKDLKAYLASVKAMHDASRRLQDCLADMYEPEWFGKEEVDALAEVRHRHTLVRLSPDSLRQIRPPMDTYLAQFPDIKARIAKRDRKMVDFDSARHHFANLQKGKKKDEAKIAKPAALLEMAAPSWAQGLISAHQVAQTNLSYNQAEEELGRAQKIFEELNVELQDELPVLFDSRVGVYVNTFQSMAKQQEKFHREMSKLSENLNDIMTKMEEQRELKKAEKKVELQRVRKPTTASQPVQHQSVPELRPSPTQSPASDTRGDSPLDDEASVNPSSQSGQTWVDLLSWDAQAWQPVTPAPQVGPGDCRHGNGHESPDQVYAQAEYAQTTEEPQDWDQNQDYASPDYGQDQDYANPDWGQSAQSYTESSWDQDQDQGAVTNGSDGEMPPGFLYKVKAVHDYAATDGDELELKVGDMVLVLAFDNPDEQDDGWLLGLKESHWAQKKDLTGKGVFPENFTTKV
ncbi:hypothetical protein WMY93_031601 [Mugilogobius chulae]|uniref:Bridging integrator 1b n=1 Tax=Mugilogobius chulae TaxID=88201 RepID=A0AAW0MKQ8_9GOBI